MISEFLRAIGQSHLKETGKVISAFELISSTGSVFPGKMLVQLMLRLLIIMIKRDFNG